MPFYPVNLQIAGKACAVIGGGDVAERKVGSLLKAEAKVSVISPVITPALSQLAQKNYIEHIDRPYRQGDLAGFFLVICATNDNEVNKSAAKEAQVRGILINVADNPDLGNFSVPSQVTRGDLLLTVSTGGKSPAMAKMLRKELSERYGSEYGIYLEILGKVRAEMKARLATSKDREQFWRENIDESIILLLRQGKIKEAEAKIKNATGSIGS
ncbi:precorrin-2 dehydrogenase/sirohydrochlorin ferrochelatase family protein [Dendrosporobacter sp. 1207_IL3150]|uniref:precorrin-2 dehydrogenase/sirohydrochlorin ferrochelatase family protein n=1 Tax=Dendrosporobacter sp. 1207_IL3150 TaxID=3084054 RepID=UPI002FD95A5D